jgi:hypothetical protein
VVDPIYNDSGSSGDILHWYNGVTLIIKNVILSHIGGLEVD